MKKKERKRLKRLILSDRNTSGNDYKKIDGLIESGHLAATVGRVTSLYIVHDDDCPALLTDGKEPCTCNPEIRM